MAYDSQELYKQALDIVKNDDKVVFMYDIICELGISTSTFYDHIKEGSNESKTLKEMIRSNAAAQKRKLRSKWYDSENATLNLCAYKLLADDDELKRLNDKEDSSTAAALGSTIANLIDGMKSDREHYKEKE